MILLLGAYGQDNLGDDILLETHLQQLVGLDVTVASSDPAQTLVRYGVPTVPTYGAQCLRAIRRADHVVLGGGSVLKELPAPQMRQRLLVGIAGAVALRGERVHMSAVGVERLDHRGSRALARYAARRAGMVHVRDEGSLRALEALGVARPDARVVADPAFLLRAPTQALLGERPLVVLNPMRSGEVECPRERVVESFAAVARRAQREHDADVVVLPFKQSGMDEDASLAREVAAAAPGARVSEGARASDVLSLLSRAALVVAMRHHAVLLALHAGAPVLAVPYAPKTERLVADAGVSEHALPAAALAPEALVAAFDAAYAGRKELAWRAQKPVAEMRELAAENFTILRDVLRGEA